MGYVWKRTEIHYMVLVGKSEGKKQIAGQRRRWEDNIKIILEKRNGSAWGG